MKLYERFDIKETTSTLNIEFKWRKSTGIFNVIEFGLVIMACIIGFIIGIALVLKMQNLIGFFLSIGFIVFSSWWFYDILSVFFNTTKIHFFEKKLHIQHVPFSREKIKIISLYDIKQIYVKETLSLLSDIDGYNSFSGACLYELRIVLKNNEEIPLTKKPMIDGDLLTKLELLIEKHLGIEEEYVKGENRIFKEK